jgi:hypothetical protein
MSDEHVNKITQFAGAMWEWAKTDKFSTVSDDVLAKRKEICTKCDYWNQAGYGGMGQCRICGCSGAKLYLPSSKCPQHLWLNVDSSDKSDTHK